MKREAMSMVLAGALAVGACSVAMINANLALAGTADRAGAPVADKAPLYPDWAKAVVPPYSNAALGILVDPGQYQFQSTDDLTAVHDWYQSHVSASWKQDATSKTWSAKVNGIQITIAELSGYKGATNNKTMIILNRR